jgi:hypothetical protein
MKYGEGLEYRDIVNRIISANSQLADFWGNSHGWAPDEAAIKMSKSRLDWQVELSKTLIMWDFEDYQQGQLILAWTNLGALIAGTLKLFLSVYHLDYIEDAQSPRVKGKLAEADTLTLERLKNFCKVKGFFYDDSILFILLQRHKPTGSNALIMWICCILRSCDQIDYPELQEKPVAVVNGSA